MRYGSPEGVCRPRERTWAISRCVRHGGFKSGVSLVPGGLLDRNQQQVSSRIDNLMSPSCSHVGVDGRLWFAFNIGLGVLPR